MFCLIDLLSSQPQLLFEVLIGLIKFIQPDVQFFVLEVLCGFGISSFVKGHLELFDFHLEMLLELQILRLQGGAFFLTLCILITNFLQTLLLLTNLNFVLFPHLNDQLIICQLEIFHTFAVTLPLQEVVFELLDSLILLLCILSPCLGHLLQLTLKAIDELFVL